MSHIDLMQENTELRALVLVLANKLADAVEVIMRHAEPVDPQRIKRIADKIWNGVDNGNC